MSEIQIDKSGEIVLTNPNMGGYHPFPGYWLDDLPPSMEGHNVLQLRVGRIYRVYPDPDPYPEAIPLPEPNPYRDYPTQYTQGEIPWSLAASLFWYNNAAWVKPNEDRETWTPIGNPNDASREITTTRDDAQTIIAQTIPSACFLPCGKTQWHTRYAEADIARTQDTRRDLWRNAYIDGYRIKESLAVSKAAFADLLSQIQSANAVEQDAPLNWTNYGQKEIHAFRDPPIDITDSSDTVEIVRLEVRHHLGQSDTNPAAIGVNLDVSVPETITLTVHVWRRESDIVFRLGDKVFAIESTPKAKILLTDDRRKAIWEAINERNVNADLPDPRPDAPDRMYRTYHTHEIDDLAMPTGPFREIIGWETLAPTEIQPDAGAPPGYTRKKGELESRGRTGTRLLAKRPKSLRLPMASPAYNSLSLLAAGPFQQLDGEDAIIAEGKDGTQLKVAYDKQIGFGPEQALQILAIKGPSVVQTFLAMTALWLEKNTNAPYDKKLSASVTDILRMKGRKPTSGGGYRNEDIMHCGRDVYILMNTSVPISSEITYKNNRPIRQQTTISRLTQIEGMTIQQTLDPSELQSVIEFVYHLGKEIYEYLAGDHPQYALASSKILQYHPEREKYQIMLGFAILYYEKVNRKKNKALHQISLTSLLEMANIELPQRNVQRFLDAITEAIEQLSQEQVIPGATVKKPAVIATKSAREILDKCHVSIPKLIDTENSEPQKSLPTPK